MSALKDYDDGDLLAELARRELLTRQVVADVLLDLWGPFDGSDSWAYQSADAVLAALGPSHVDQRCGKHRTQLLYHAYTDEHGEWFCARCESEAECHTSHGDAAAQQAPHNGGAA